MDKNRTPLPKYDIIIRGEDMCISFVCTYLGVPVSALINEFSVDKDDRLKLDLSFPKSITEEYKEQHIKMFQEQILECCYDTLLKQKAEQQSRTINRD